VLVSPSQPNIDANLPACDRSSTRSSYSASPPSSTNLGTLGKSGVQVPLARNPFQRWRSAVFERYAGAGYEVADGARHEDFPGLRGGGHPCPDVDRDATDFPINDLTFPGVQSSPDFDAEALN
jgi:hypothetical protein